MTQQNKTILAINVLRHEQRVALVEKGTLAELYIERTKERTLVGNIYLGKVVRVLVGMDAAFVDIGTSKAGFLYVSDVLTPSSEAELGMIIDEDHENDVSENADELELHALQNKNACSISNLLHEGQQVLVQITKTPIGTKGARLTTNIALPGRLLVFMPTVSHVGVSRKITNEKERVRLKEMVENMSPANTGFIVRTAAKGASQDMLEADMNFLTSLWDDIQSRAEKSSAPTNVYQEFDLIRRVTRDMFTPEVDQLLIDDTNEYKNLLQFVAKFMPSLGSRVELYSETEPLFDVLGLEGEISQALDHKVWLKSGGYIVIDQTEALTAIDVNTGRYVGKHNLEDTITKINLEAVKEIISQLRLRNIGGIIIIDFIDMDKQANRNKVYKSLEEALTGDRMQTSVCKISELGLVEMTRKRVRENLTHAMTQICPYCEGSGHVKSLATVCFEILRTIEREARVRKGSLLVSTHPDVAKYLITEEQSALEDLESRLGVHVRVNSLPHYHIEQYNVLFDKNG